MPSGPAAERLLAAARGCGVVPECRVPSGPAAREIATREPAARSGRSRSPPVPSGPCGTPHAGCPWCLCPAASRSAMLVPVGVKKAVHPIRQARRTAAAPYIEDIRQPHRAVRMSSLYIARIHRPWAPRLVGDIACPSLHSDGLAIVSRATCGPGRTTVLPGPVRLAG